MEQNLKVCWVGVFVVGCEIVKQGKVNSVYRQLMILQFLVNGFCSGALIGLIAFGLSLIYNTTKVFHFAHGAVYTAAAYLLFFFITKTSIGVISAVALALTLAMLLGVLMDRFFYLPLAEKR